MQTVR